MRIGLEDGAIVAVGFYPKGKSKSSVAVQHAKLPDREAAREMKEYWSKRLEVLDAELEAEEHGQRSHATKGGRKKG